MREVVAHYKNSKTRIPYAVNQGFSKVVLIFAIIIAMTCTYSHIHTGFGFTLMDFSTPCWYESEFEYPDNMNYIRKRRYQTHYHYNEYT